MNLSRRGLMATRHSMDELMQQCEDALRFANEQYQESSLQQQYNDDNYTQALQQLEGAYNDFAQWRKVLMVSKENNFIGCDFKYNKYKIK